MTIKWCGQRMGGWIIVEKWRVKYYFYYARFLPGYKGKVLARVFCNYK